MARNRFNCYFSFWTIFCPKKSKLKKNEKNAWRYDFTIVTTNHHHMLYFVPEIWCVTDVIIFHFWAIFCPFTPLTTRKIKISKKWKQLLDISSFYTTKIMIICYTVPEIWRVTGVIVIFHIGLFFALLPTNSPQNENLKKKWKKRLEISSFYICVPKIMIRWCTAEIWWATDGRRDGREKWQSWVPHLKTRAVCTQWTWCRNWVGESLNRNFDERKYLRALLVDYQNIVKDVLALKLKFHRTKV